VTDDNRLTIHYNGVNIVDLSRDFIDTKWCNVEYQYHCAF